MQFNLNSHIHVDRASCLIIVSIMNLVGVVSNYMAVIMFTHFIIQGQQKTNYLSLFVFCFENSTPPSIDR